MKNMDPSPNQSAHLSMSFHIYGGHPSRRLQFEQRMRSPSCVRAARQNQREIREFKAEILGENLGRTGSGILTVVDGNLQERTDVVLETLAMGRAWAQSLEVA